MSPKPYISPNLNPNVHPPTLRTCANLNQISHLT
jgi:hypothetical protein